MTQDEPSSNDSDRSKSPDGSREDSEKVAWCRSDNKKDHGLGNGSNHGLSRGSNHGSSHGSGHRRRTSSRRRSSSVRQRSRRSTSQKNSSSQSRRSHSLSRRERTRRHTSSHRRRRSASDPRRRRPRAGSVDAARDCGTSDNELTDPAVVDAKLDVEGDERDPSETSSSNDNVPPPPTVSETSPKRTPSSRTRKRRGSNTKLRHRPDEKDYRRAGRRTPKSRSDSIGMSDSRHDRRKHFNKARSENIPADDSNEKIDKGRRHSMTELAGSYRRSGVNTSNHDDRKLPLRNLSQKRLSHRPNHVEIGQPSVRLNKSDDGDAEELGDDLSPREAKEGINQSSPSAGQEWLQDRSDKQNAILSSICDNEEVQQENSDQQGDGSKLGQNEDADEDQPKLSQKPTVSNWSKAISITRSAAKGSLNAVKDPQRAHQRASTLVSNLSKSLGKGTVKAVKDPKKAAKRAGNGMANVAVGSVNVATGVTKGVAKGTLGATKTVVKGSLNATTTVVGGTVKGAGVVVKGTTRLVTGRDKQRVKEEDVSYDARARPDRQMTNLCDRVSRLVDNADTEEEKMSTEEEIQQMLANGTQRSSFLPPTLPKISVTGDGSWDI